MSSDSSLPQLPHTDEVAHDGASIPDETLQIESEGFSDENFEFQLSKAAMTGDLEGVKRLLAEVHIDEYLPRDRERGSGYGPMEPPLTALQSAARWGHQRVVEELIKEGAHVGAKAWEDYGRTALQAAAESGRTKIVEILLKAGAEVNAAPAEVQGRTALQAAAGGGHGAVVDVLLKAGAEVNAAPKDNGRTALQAAAGGGHGAVVDALLKAGAEVNAAPKYNGRTALQAAAEGGHGAVVDALLKAGAEVNAASKDNGRTALQAAAEGGHGAVVGVLLKAGAEVNAVPKDNGRTALQAAAEGGHGAVVDVLLKAGAEVNAAPKDNGRTALQAAAGGGHGAVVDVLLKAGAEVNAAPAEFRGRTALQAAAGGGHGAVVDVLLKAGAEVNAAPAKYNGRTALQAAAGGGHGAVVDVLLKAGAEVNAAPVLYGRTALQAAAEGGHGAVVDVLLKAGAEVNAAPAEVQGRTALQAAAEGGHGAVVDVLLKAGAEVNAAPAKYNGRTALQAAAGGGHGAVVDVLLKAGAEVNAVPKYNGRTALQAAAEGGHGAVVDVLLKAGAEVNAASAKYNGRTALQAAAEGGHGAVVDVLLGAWNEVDASRVKSGMLTDAITEAIMSGNLAMLKLLMNSEATPAAEDFTRQTRLHLAIVNFRFTILRYLLTSKSPHLINERNGDGMTILHIAAKENYVSLVPQILAANPNLEIRNNRGQRPLDIVLQGESLNRIGDMLLKKGAYIRDLQMGIWRTYSKATEKELILLRDTLTGSKDVNAVSIDNVPKFQYNSDLVSEKHLYSTYGIQPAINEFFFSPAFKNHRPKSHRDDAMIEWGWFIPGNPFNDGIPDDGRSTPFTGVITCYISFNILTSNPTQEEVVTRVANMGITGASVLGQHGLKPFETLTEKSEILWMMWNPKAEATTSVSSTGNSAKPKIGSSDTKTSIPMCRSMHFRSTMNHGWIPRHGVEFFTLFIRHIHEQWATVGAQAEAHLANSRTTVLLDKGRSSKLIDSLLKDAQQWDSFHRLLRLHVRQAKWLLKKFRETPILHDEVRVYELENERNALRSLEKRIDEMEHECEEQISDLDKRTQALIGLVFNLVSIHEAQISTSTAMSMKRLSWITFVFLPMIFVSSIFGMNVNLFNPDCPMWWWYLVVSGPALVLILVVWLIFKYIKVETWVESTVGVYLENLANSLSKNLKDARSRNHEKNLDLESGSERKIASVSASGRAGRISWLNSKKVKNT